MKRLARLILLGLFTLIFSFTHSQINRKAVIKNNRKISRFQGRKNIFQGYYGVGFSLNGLDYFGDLSPLPNKFSTDISFTRPGFGVSFYHRYGPRYTVLGQLMYGTLRGSDAESAHGTDGKWRQERNLSFRNHIKEFSLTAVIDLYENQGTYISRVKFTPYVFAGLTFFLHNPQGKAPEKFLDGSPDPFAGQWVDLRPLGTEGQYSNLKSTDVNYGIKPYSLLQFAIPFGLGARVRLNEVVDLWADIGFRYTFTDYLDDVSRNYVDINSIHSRSNSAIDNKLAQAMSYRSNEIPIVEGFSASPYPLSNDPNFIVLNGYGTEQKYNWRGHASAKDIYMVTSFKITYVLGKTFHRANFR